MAAADLPDFVQALLSPGAYPHAIDRIELVQTHISYVLLAGDYVYKIKKPVDWGFLDYSTLEKRRFYCEEEVRLNRRLCAETYLGVLPITLQGGKYVVGGEGEAVEYAVQMRRLPEERMMESLLRQNAVSGEMLIRLTAKLVEFHGNSERNNYIDSFGSLDTIGGNWQENFDQTEPFIDRTIRQEQWDDIKGYVGRFLERERGLLVQRVGEGRIRDCHGDMRSNAVCFVDGVCVFDCIEFNERFRHSDVASDLAFLAMDLDYQGHRVLSDELVGLYLAQSQDSTMPLVLHFYKCYRAFVRGKVDGFQLDQPEIPDSQKEAVCEGARRYFQLAHEYASRPAGSRLIMMVGVTGSGKSYLAYALSSRFGAPVISSDVVRKELAGLAPDAPQVEAIDKGIYSDEMTARTYAEMLLRARSLLKDGRTVILDATHLIEKQRQGVRRLAMDMKAPLLAVECVASGELVRERLDMRANALWTPSDGRWEVYEAQRGRMEPLSELRDKERLTLDMSLPLGEQIEAVESRIEAPSRD